MTKSICIVGPQGCGKTLHAPQLVAHFGLQRFVDLEPWDVPTVKPTGVLYLTCDASLARRMHTRALVITFDEAIALMKANKQLKERA